MVSAYQMKEYVVAQPLSTNWCQKNNLGGLNGPNKSIHLENRFERLSMASKTIMVGYYPLFTDPLCGLKMVVEKTVFDVVKKKLQKIQTSPEPGTSRVPCRRANHWAAVT